MIAIPIEEIDVSTPDRSRVAQLLAGLEADPDDRASADELFAAIHEELTRRAAHRVRGNDPVTMSATDLVHETYIKMVGSDPPPVRTRTRFLAIASHAMRQVLVDYLRAKSAEKRGGDRRQVTLTGLAADTSSVDVDSLDLDRALTDLEALDARMATIVQLRFFAGLTMDEVAEELDVTRRTVQRDWRVARVWLKERLLGGVPEPE